MGVGGGLEGGVQKVAAVPRWQEIPRQDRYQDFHVKSAGEEGKGADANEEWFGGVCVGGEGGHRVWIKVIYATELFQRKWLHENIWFGPSSIKMSEPFEAMEPKIGRCV